jgi:hypothetical protein
MSMVLRHFAKNSKTNNIILSRIFTLNKIVPYLVSGSGTVVEKSTRNLKFKGLNAAAAG